MLRSTIYLVTDTETAPSSSTRTTSARFFLRGPVYIGPCAKSTSTPPSKIRLRSPSHLSWRRGRGCIIEPFSNRQHAGFLGHRYVGSWVISAGRPLNSDLKTPTASSTWSIKPQRHEAKSLTGLQFVGCFIGRLHQNRLSTPASSPAKTMGSPASFTASSPPTFSFCSYAAHSYLQRKFRSGLTDLPAEIMISVQQRMFVRSPIPDTANTISNFVHRPICPAQRRPPNSRPSTRAVTGERRFSHPNSAEYDLRPNQILLPKSYFLH